MSFFSLRGIYWACVFIISFFLIPRTGNAEYLFVGVLIWGLSVFIRVSCRSVVGDHTRGSKIETEELIVRGGYSLSRNPLYISNLLMVLGLLFVGGWSFEYIIIVMMMSFWFYEMVIREEECFLRKKFGSNFDEYTVNVNRWLGGHYLKNMKSDRTLFEAFLDDFWTWFWQALILILLRF